jgi:uncharacterized protein (DUF433 family)
MIIPRLAAAKLTVPEAAFVAGVSERAIHHEIDARVLRPIGPAERRTISGDDLLYLAAVRGVREHLAPLLRRRLRDAVSTAARNHQRVAKVAAFEVPLRPIEAEIIPVLAKLESVRSKHVASDPKVLAGEPVLRGTRIAARLVADLIKRGISHEQIAEEYDLTAEQIEAAVLFDRVTPRRGRPPRRRQAAPKRLHLTKHDVPAAG